MVGARLASATCAIGRALIAIGAVRLAQHSFRFAHELSPEHVSGLRYLAWCSLHRGDPSGALEYYGKLIKLAPEFVDGRIECGFAFSRLGRYPEALEQFQSALDYSPRDARARTALVGMLLELHHFVQAIPHCQELLRQDRSDVFAWGMLGKALTGAGRWEDALAAYESAQAIHPEPVIAAEHAGALMELNRFRDAEAILKTALMKNGTDLALLAQLAQVLAELGHHTDAETLLREVLTKDPVNRVARTVQAVVLAGQGRRSEATAVARQLVTDFPDDAEALATQGWVALKSGGAPQALAAFEEALRIEPGRAQFVAGRATALKHLGRDAEARTDARWILERDPSFFDRHREWSELLTPPSEAN